MSFYISTKIKLNNKSIILYPEIGIEKIVGNKPEIISNHLSRLYRSNTEVLNKGDYHIIILWHDQKDMMTDIWIHTLSSGLEEYSTIDVVNFRNEKRYFDQGITSGDGLILLGAEEEKRRKSNSLDEYLNNREIKLKDIVLSRKIF